MAVLHSATAFLFLSLKPLHLGFLQSICRFKQGMSLHKAECFMYHKMQFLPPINIS
jgi:hypothetical protein